MRQCSIPRCRTRVKLHCVPFTDRLRWEQWLNIIPYFGKYNAKQLEQVRICNLHFQSHHIDETGRLTKDAYPIYYLTPSELKKKYNGLKCNKVLEICPLESDKPVNIKITDSSPTSDKESNHLTYLVKLKVGKKSGLPVDHNKYCLPPQRAKISACPCELYSQPPVPSSELDDSVLGTKPSELDATRKPQKQTLKSLVADIIQSDGTAEIIEFEPRTKLRKPKQYKYLKPKTIRLPISNLANSMPFIELQPLTFNTKIKRVRLDMDNCTVNERNLRLQNNLIKRKIKNLNYRYTKLKSKTDSILEYVTGYINSYPHLSPKEKLLLDMQIRLGSKCKNSRGHRYTEEEKIFAIKLFKISPDCYWFLQPYLKLPGQTTLKEAFKNCI